MLLELVAILCAVAGTTLLHDTGLSWITSFLILIGTISTGCAFALLVVWPIAMKYWFKN
jgi:Na+/H+-dicarboxylate symporter